MKNLKRLLESLTIEDSGQEQIEYALAAALAGFRAAVAMKELKNSIGTTFNGICTSLTSAA